MNCLTLSVDFAVNRFINPVNISSFGSDIAGESYSLTCSATLVDPVPLPSNIPTPTFEWFFGPNGNASLPSGVTPTATTLSSGYTYSSTLSFSLLTQSHSGVYTCRLGVGILANNNTIVVKGILNFSADIHNEIMSLFTCTSSTWSFPSDQYYWIFSVGRKWLHTFVLRIWS